MRRVAEAAADRRRIDLYYQHRVDPQVPIEETVGAMAISSGRARCVISGCRKRRQRPSAARMRFIRSRRCRRNIRSGAASPTTRRCQCCASWASRSSPTARSGAAFSPGASGRSTTSRRRLAPRNPRFQGENFAKNLAVVDQVKQIAEEKGVTPAQLALAWMLNRHDDVIPIPGTSSAERLAENAAAADIRLTKEDLERIECAAEGARIRRPVYAGDDDAGGRLDAARSISGGLGPAYSSTYPPSIVALGCAPRCSRSSVMIADLSLASRRDQVRDFTSRKKPSADGFVRRSTWT